MTALVDRIRALSPPSRAEILDRIMQTPGALSDVRYDWQGFWGRDDQIVTLDELQANPLVFFTGERGTGKTTAALHLFWWLIREGHVRSPRVFAKTEADVEKVIVGAKKEHSKATTKGEPTKGLLAIIPPEERPEWIKDEGPAGVLRCRNGIEVVCFAAVDPEQCVSHEGDCDLVDDIAKWGPHAFKAWFHQQASLRKGMGVTIAASTRRGIDVLRTLLGVGPQGPIPGVLIRRPPEVGANRFNLTANLRGRVHAVAGGDLARQDMDDEDVAAESPFAGLPWDVIHIPSFDRAELDEIIVAVDPAEGKGGDHDEWGIGCAGRRAADAHTIVIEDASGAYDDAEAGNRVLELCERRGVSKIIVETNRGARVVQTLRAAHATRELARLRVDPTARPKAMPELLEVRVKEGKALRAGPVRTCYLDGRVHHMPGLDALDKRGIEARSLEKQMREWNPGGPKRPRQDDRIDWTVHAVTYLARLSGDGGEQAAETAAQCALAAKLNAALVGRPVATSPPPGATTVPAQKVPGAPPGDARHDDGRAPRAASRTPSWRSRSVF